MIDNTLPKNKRVRQYLKILWHNVYFKTGIKDEISVRLKLKSSFPPVSSSLYSLSLIHTVLSRYKSM